MLAFYSYALLKMEKKNCLTPLQAPLLALLHSFLSPQLYGQLYIPSLSYSLLFFPSSYPSLPLEVGTVVWEAGSAVRSLGL